MDKTVLIKSNLKPVERTRQQQCELLHSSQFMDQLIHASYSSGLENDLNLKYLKDGLSLQIFSPVLVINSIAKLPLGKTMRCFMSALDVASYCTSLLKTTELAKPAEICKSISKITYWLLENSIEIYKLLYSTMKEPILFLPDAGDCIQVIEKSQDFLRELISNDDYENLNYIGKLLFGEKEKTSLQIQLQELLSFQLDKIKTHVSYDSFETLLKDFMKLNTRFLNATTFSHVDFTKRPYVSQSLNIFMQFQVMLCLPISSLKIANFFEIFMKVEGISIELLLVSLYRLSINNILIRKEPIEENIFIAFLFLKLPAIFHHLEKKCNQYLEKECNQYLGEENVVYRALLEMSKVAHDDINNVLGCSTFNAFVMQCEVKQALNVQQMKALLKLEDSNQTNDNVVGKLFDAAKKCEEILKMFTLPIDGSMDQLTAELQTLLNNTDLVIILIAFAATDKLSKFINCLLSINLFTQKPPDSKDAYADVRADLFNNSFLLLCFIDVRFEDKAFVDVPSELQNAFYYLWRKKCTLVTSRKLYNQTVFDRMMDPLIQHYQPSVNNAQWDEYCWSVGMIVKELTQAHLRRHFTTDALQKVCEGFKNRRPALCICAMVWLCTQYKTMPPTERSRTAKIINLFRRPHQNASKAAIWTPILQKYSLSLEADLLAANTKSKTVTSDPYEVTCSKLSNILTTSNLLVDHSFLTKITEMQAAMSTSFFLESLIKLILLTGKEEEALALEAVCTGILFMKPMEFMSEIFQNTLKSLFHYGGPIKLFADPQGACLSKCISKAFAMSLTLHTNEDETTLRHLASPIMNSLERQHLDLIFTRFLQENLLMLSTHEENAVTMFVMKLINEIAMVVTIQKKPLLIKDEKIVDLLCKIRPKIRRDLLSILCDLTNKNGLEKAAAILCW